MVKNFHRNPFDEGTRTKLELFGDTIREWLPVWIEQVKPGVPITIVDFFAGPGRDVNGLAGSPLIALAEIRSQGSRIREKKSAIRLRLYEKAKRKADNLREVMHAENVPDDLCKWEVQNRDFDSAFPALYPTLKMGPNLLLLDQQGMKAMSDEVFKLIIALRRTDFLFFIASSSIRRFEEHPNFQTHLKIPRGEISGSDFNDTHRRVTRYYRKLARDDESVFLGNFSIKKGSNIYGLIFGSGHPLGLHKFLRGCWKTDPLRGEANFDIDDDRIDSDYPNMFADMNRPKKIIAFEDSLRSKILEGALTTDRAVYVDTIQKGFLPKHGRKILQELIANKKVRVMDRQRPRVSIQGYNNPRTLEVIADGAV